MNKTLYCDFDGVIHKARFGHRNGELYDEPTEGVAFTLTNLMKAGYQVKIFTSRTEEDYPKIHKWLKKQGIPDMEITNVKGKDALAFIDDRAIRFTTWADIVHYFL